MNVRSIINFPAVTPLSALTPQTDNILGSKYKLVNIKTATVDAAEGVPEGEHFARAKWQDGLTQGFSGERASVSSVSNSEDISQEVSALYGHLKLIVILTTRSCCETLP